MRMRWLVIAMVLVALAPRQIVGFSQSVVSTVVEMFDQMVGAAQ